MLYFFRYSLCSPRSSPTDKLHLIAISFCFFFYGIRFSAVLLSVIIFSFNFFDHFFTFLILLSSISFRFLFCFFLYLSILFLFSFSFCKCLLFPCLLPLFLDPKFLTNPILVSDGELDTLDAALANAFTSSAVNVQAVDLSNLCKRRCGLSWSRSKI